jgi:AraC-like DNA-binding protein
MTASTLVSRASTEDIAPRDRIGYWEEYNREQLVGLSCTPYSEQGLLARELNYRLDRVRLADISGNAHVVERTRSMARSAPKESVFATLLLNGDAVFMNEHGCLSASAGDLVVYGTRQPYLFGFSGTMRQYLVDIPRELFAEEALKGDVPGPILFGRASAREGELVLALRTLMTNAAAGRVERPDEAIVTVLRTLTAERAGYPPEPGTYTTQLTIATDYIERHLHHPDLTPSRVAAFLGISVRHLSRVFDSAGTTPARHIMNRRLRNAYDELAGPAATNRVIADVAHRWGFSSQAHFARAFRAHFGLTPTEVRRTHAERHAVHMAVAGDTR